ncbi:MAG: hypothetical protein XXXJIFNMEKO3_01627 [Candidatus Erwinia impunctatus]|nr:hypothetical protein XXXJIFNMEKO_01627 [Culicoides impunctatus]
MKLKKGLLLLTVSLLLPFSSFAQPGPGQTSPASCAAPASWQIVNLARRRCCRVDWWSDLLRFEW